MWKDVNVGSGGQSCNSSFKTSLPFERNNYHFEDDCREKTVYFSPTLFLLLTLSYSNEKSDNYGNELQVEKCGHAKFVREVNFLALPNAARKIIHFLNQPSVHWRKERDVSIHVSLYDFQTSSSPRVQKRQLCKVKCSLTFLPCNLIEKLKRYKSLSQHECVVRYALKRFPFLIYDHTVALIWPYDESQLIKVITCFLPAQRVFNAQGAVWHIEQWAH